MAADRVDEAALEGHAVELGLGVLPARGDPQEPEVHPLDIVYRSRGDVRTAQRILPLSMVYADKAIMLLAWCTLHHDFRMFRAPCIVELTVTPESFRPRRVALLREYLQRLSG